MKELFAAALLTILSFAVYPQAPMAVGDEVKYQCFCFGQEWVNGKVEAVSGGNVRVRFGNMDDQVITLPMSSPKLKASVAEWMADPMQKAFAAEAAPTYRKSVSQFAHFYDSQFTFIGGLVHPPEWQKAMADLAELDSLCRSRYSGVKDFQTITYVQPGNVDYRFGTWCAIAAKRNEIEPRVRAGMAKELVNLGYTEENLNFGFNEPDNPVRMETQRLIWERDKWRAEKIAWLKPKYAQYGSSVPADATADAEKRADELKAMVLRDAPGRSYKQPSYHDAAIEAFMKRKFAAEYPGSQVLKIGLDYRTWVKRESLTYVASDELFNYYKVGYNSYKRGTVLLKVPGRPFCQTQDWVVGQSGGGLVAVAVGGSGTFMRCE
jgi:hypothetical protein